MTQPNAAAKEQNRLQLPPAFLPKFCYTVVVPLYCSLDGQAKIFSELQNLSSYTGTRLACMGTAQKSSGGCPAWLWFESMTTKPGEIVYA
jgi:hypothetical protein